MAIKFKTSKTTTVEKEFTVPIDKYYIKTWDKDEDCTYWMLDIHKKNSYLETIAVKVGYGFIRIDEDVNAIPWQLEQYFAAELRGVDISKELFEEKYKETNSILSWTLFVFFIWNEGIKFYKNDK